MVGLFPERHLSSGPVRTAVSSGLRLASSKFRKFVRISDLAYFFAEICLIWQDLAKNRRRHEKRGI